MHNPRLKSIDAAFVVQKCILYLGVTQIIIWQDNKTHGCNTFCDCSCICCLHCLSHLSHTKLPHVCLWEGSWFLVQPLQGHLFYPPFKKIQGVDLNVFMGSVCMSVVFIVRDPLLAFWNLWRVYYRCGKFECVQHYWSWRLDIKLHIV
jgi:hypothetical protein